MYKQKTFRPASALDSDDDYSDDYREPVLPDYQSLAVLSFFDSLSRGSFLAAAGSELTQYIYTKISKLLSSWSWSDLRKVKVRGGNPEKTYIRYCVIIDLSQFQQNIVQQYDFRTPTNTLSGVFIRNNQLFLPAGVFLAYGAYNTYQGSSDTTNPENTCDNIQAKLKEQEDIIIKLNDELNNIKIQNLNEIGKEREQKLENAAKVTDATMEKSKREENIFNKNIAERGKKQRDKTSRSVKLRTENKKLKKENERLINEIKRLEEVFNETIAENVKKQRDRTRRSVKLKQENKKLNEENEELKEENERLKKENERLNQENEELKSPTMENV